MVYYQVLDVCTSKNHKPWIHPVCIIENYLIKKIQILKNSYLNLIYQVVFIYVSRLNSLLLILTHKDIKDFRKSHYDIWIPNKPVQVITVFSTSVLVNTKLHINLKPASKEGLTYVNIKVYWEFNDMVYYQVLDVCTSKNHKPWNSPIHPVYIIENYLINKIQTRMYNQIWT